jgi:hypothetical protein
MRGAPFIGAYLLLLLVSGTGCSPSQVVVHAQLDPSHEHLMHIGSAYNRFNAQYKKAPGNVADLLPFLKEFGNPDELLRSPKDGAPYVICWGVDLQVPQTWARSTGVLAYEKYGAAGQRYVLTTLRSVILMTDNEFRQASFPPGHQPPR